MGNELGNYMLTNNRDLFVGFNILKGFLNLAITPAFWLNFLSANYNNKNFGMLANTKKE